MLFSFVSANMNELTCYVGTGRHTTTKALHFIGSSSDALQALWLIQAKTD